MVAARYRQQHRPTSCTMCPIKLIQQLFSNRETHPVVHEHETVLYLLKEAEYVQHVQMLMHWIGVDESTDTLLTFQNLNIDDEPAPSQPQPPTQQPMQPPAP